jgi:chaperonin GroES
MSKIKPLNGFIVLKPVEEQEQTYGNIVIPDLGKERPEMGEVVAVSETYNWHTDTNVKSGINVGDKVLIPKMGSMKITMEGEDYFIAKDTEILAVITE